MFSWLLRLGLAYVATSLAVRYATADNQPEPKRISPPAGAPRKARTSARKRSA